MKTHPTRLAGSAVRPQSDVAPRLVERALDVQLLSRFGRVEAANPSALDGSAEIAALQEHSLEAEEEHNRDQGRDRQGREEDI